MTEPSHSMGTAAVACSLARSAATTWPPGTSE